MREREDVAWLWLGEFAERRFGEEPSDVAYSADQMVDAFLAGNDAALSLPRSPENGEGIVDALGEYLAEQDEDNWCQRLKYGKCSLRKCHVDSEGHLPPTPIDFDNASCPRFRLEQARTALSSPSRGTGR